MSNIKVIEKLKSFFETRSNIAAAYLYGSYATEKNTHKSDVDIAILMELEKTSTERFSVRNQIRSDLSRLLRKDVDLVIMNEAGETLLLEILTRGKLIFEKNRDIHRRFRAIRLTDCIDFGFYMKRMQNGMTRAMRSAKVG